MYFLRMYDGSHMQFNNCSFKSYAIEHGYRNIA